MKKVQNTSCRHVGSASCLQLPTNTAIKPARAAKYVFQYPRQLPLARGIVLMANCSKKRSCAVTT